MIKESMLAEKIIIFIILISVVFLAAGFVFARELEVPLPKTGDEPAIKETPLLPNYIKYIFNFGIGIAGLIAFGALVYGGFRYLTSAGNPSAMSDANSQIWASLIGLIVILGSWLLLTTINPQLIIINPKLGESGLVVTATSGVYLCKDNLGSTCDGPYSFDKDTLSKGFDDKTAYIKFVDSGTEKFGAVLHKNAYLQGDCEVFLSTGDPNPIGMSKLPSQVSSISVFRKDISIIEGGVTLCENSDCRKNNRDDKQEAKKLFTWTMGQEVSGFDSSILRGFADLENYTYDNGDKIGGGWDYFNRLNRGVSAIEVQNYMAILFGQDNYQGICELFAKNDPNLGLDNIIGNDKAASMMIIKGK